MVIRMKCSEVRAFLSQIASGSVSMPVQQPDVDFLSANGYLSVMTKDEYDQALAEVSKLTQLNEDLQNEEAKERTEEAVLEEEEKKTHSLLFHFEGREKREAELEAVERDRAVVSKEETDIAEKTSRINELIQKKSAIDRVVEYNGMYLSLTHFGVTMLNALNVRNYRVSDTEFLDFVEEIEGTTDELLAIAEKAKFHVSRLGAEFQNDRDTDEDEDEDDDEDNEDDDNRSSGLPQLWSTSIGLAKLPGDPDDISRRFLLAYGTLKDFHSTVENKMMAAEVMATSTADPQSLSETLKSIDDELRHDMHVPGELSAGVAAIILFGKRFDGTYPTDRFAEFSKITASYESAAILSVANNPGLGDKFWAFRSLFSSWGYETSEDTELASAYLSISDLGPDDVKTKLTIVLDALRNYLEYPLVAAAILASIPTLEANETLDLMEKACTVLGPVATGLEHSELVSLAVRMIHGIRNELVKELDSTATVAKTPVQFTYARTNAPFIYYWYWLTVVHSSYYSRFSGIGGYHPAHVHGVGGFMG
jgi:hypothetical protein